MLYNYYSDRPLLQWAGRALILLVLSRGGSNTVNLFSFTNYIFRDIRETEFFAKTMPMKIWCPLYLNGEGSET